jgi:N-hydroxyarylamine O-acetyltransferase
MDVNRYLQRIQYQGARTLGAVALRALHLAHLYTIPFENLDIHLGTPIRLDLEAVFDKVIVRRRGGFCYELNGLFGALLRELGFEVRLLAADDFHEDGSYGLAFDHLALAVQAPGDPTFWLADVGYGDSFLEPLVLEARGEQVQGPRTYRIDCDGGDYFLWQRKYDRPWERLYHFTLQARQYSDFAEMCAYHQTSPDSIFVKNRICTLATVDGRVSLDSSRLITTVRDHRTEAPVEDAEMYRQILRERFGVALEKDFLPKSHKI